MRALLSVYDKTDLDKLAKYLVENKFELISRPPASAPAVGLMKLHLQQQKELVDNVLSRK